MTNEPDICLAGLSLWVGSREFEALDDYWDGNWLVVRGRVEAPGAVVEAKGSWLRSDEIERFADKLMTLHRDLKGSAELQCLEPTLNAKVVCGARGQIEVIVEFTPDHLTQSHRFEFAIDQSYLVATLQGCQRVLERFPVRGVPTDA